MRSAPAAVFASAAFALVFLGTTPVPAPAPAGAAGPEYVEGEVLVILKPGATGASFGAMGYGAQASAAGERVRKLILPPGETVEEALARLAENAEVEVAQPNYIYRPAFTPSDPFFSLQAHLTQINAPPAWDVAQGDTQVVIAILDTGADTDHSDLAARLTIVAGSDPIDGDDDPDDDATIFSNGHGTAVSGVAGAIWENATFGVGVDRNARILPVRVLGTDGTGTSDTIAAGIRLADDTADVINLSLGSTTSCDSDQVLCNAIQDAVAAGVVVVAAAGNDNAGSLLFPASHDSTVAVGSVTSDDARSSFSNFGDGLDVMAPGENVVTIANNDTFQVATGTSFSAPQVAAAAAIVRSLRPGAPPATVRGFLRAGTKDLGEPGWDEKTGFGRIDLAAVVRLARSVIDYDSVPGTFLFDTFASLANADSHQASTTTGDGPAGAAALLLNAADSFVGYAPGRFPTDSGAIEFYVFPDTTQGSGKTRILLTQAGDGTLGNGELDLRLDSDTRLVLRQGGGATITAGASERGFRLGEWNHIAVEYGTGGLVLWVNGETVGAGLAVNLAAETIFLGSPSFAGTEVPLFGRYGRLRVRGGHDSSYPTPRKVAFQAVDGKTTTVTTSGQVTVHWKTFSSETGTAVISIGIDDDTSGFDGTILASGLADDGVHTVDVSPAMSDGQTKFLYVIAEGSPKSFDYAPAGVVFSSAASLDLGGGASNASICALLRGGVAPRAGAYLRAIRDAAFELPFLRALVRLWVRLFYAI